MKWSKKRGIKGARAHGCRLYAVMQSHNEGFQPISRTGIKRVASAVDEHVGDAVWCGRSYYTNESLEDKKGTINMAECSTVRSSTARAPSPP